VKPHLKKQLGMIENLSIPSYREDVGRRISVQDWARKNA
jgi:hypothetical protein